MSSLNISYEPGRRSRDELNRKADRQKEMLQYLPRLQEQYTPEEVSSIARNYIEGKGLNLPSMRSQLLPPEEGVDVPTRSIQNPIQYQQPETTIVSPDGNIVRTVKGKASTVKTLPNKPRAGLSGGDPNSMDTDNLRAIMNTYSRMLDSEIPGTPEYQGIQEEMVPYRDEMRARLKRSSVQPTATGKPAPKADPGNTEKQTYNSAGDVKAAYKAGKLSKEAAAAILEEKFGMK